MTDLRRWLDLPDRRGLREDLQDLVILTWLAKSNRFLYRFGQPFKGEIGNVPNECEVREQPLPTTAEWDKATRLAGEMLVGPPWRRCIGQHRGWWSFLARHAGV